MPNTSNANAAPIVGECEFCRKPIWLDRATWRHDSPGSMPICNHIPVPYRAPIVEPAPGKKAFVAIKLAVMYGAEHVATAISHTMAKRIARALNSHRTNSKGY